MLAGRTDAFAALQRYAAAAERSYRRAYQELKDTRSSGLKAEIAAMDSLLSRSCSSQPTMPVKPAVQNEPNRPAPPVNLALRL